MDEPVAAAFDTWLDLSVPLSPEEFEQECQHLVRRQRAIADLLEGKESISTVEEMLFEDGIDPYEWAGMAEQNLIWMLNQCPGDLWVP